MGYGSYQLPDGRWAGYNIGAECDKPGCTIHIDRGLAYLCGRDPDGHRDSCEPGCGQYHCPDHQFDHDCPNPDGHADCDDDCEGRIALRTMYLERIADALDIHDDLRNGPSTLPWT